MYPAIQSNTARTWKSVQAHHFIAGALALVLAALVATGGWQLSKGGGGTSPVQHVSLAVSAPPLAAPRQTAMTYYLVSTQDEANLLQGGIDAQGADPRYFNFVVVKDDEALNQEVQLVVHENDILYANGQPEIKLVDLRGPVR
jgi:hypothetical protein